MSPHAYFHRVQAMPAPLFSCTDWRRLGAIAFLAFSFRNNAPYGLNHSLHRPMSRRLSLLTLMAVGCNFCHLDRATSQQVQRRNEPLFLQVSQRIAGNVQWVPIVFWAAERRGAGAGGTVASNTGSGVLHSPTTFATVFQIRQVETLEPADDSAFP